MVAEMGGHVEKQLLSAIDSLVNNDKEQGQKVVRGDEMLDTLQHNIEFHAVFQPDATGAAAKQVHDKKKVDSNTYLVQGSFKCEV